MTSYCLLTRPVKTWRKRRAPSYRIADAIRDECLNKSRLCITKKSFLSYLKLPAQHPIDMTREQIWDELLKHKLFIAVSDAAMPAIHPPTELETLFAVKPPDAKPEIVYKHLRDIPGLIRYAKGSADREANASQTITYLDKCLVTLKRKGSGKLSAALAKTIEDLASVREKMTRSEELLERACQQDIPPASARGGDCGDKRQRLCGKTSAAPEVRKFSYERNFQGLVQTRAYVQGDGAQKWRRRMLRVLCPQTHDLDKGNAVFDILHQLILRLGCKETMPGSCDDAPESSSRPVRRVHERTPHHCEGKEVCIARSTVRRRDSTSASRQRVSAEFAEAVPLPAMDCLLHAS